MYIDEWTNGAVGFETPSADRVAAGSSVSTVEPPLPESGVPLTSTRVTLRSGPAAFGIIHSPYPR
jgi:hypothetical protein